eukprot:s1104_g1.t3
MSDGLVVGTYLAEQVALTSYALLSVSQADAKRSQISAVPSGPRAPDVSRHSCPAIPCLSYRLLAAVELSVELSVSFEPRRDHNNFKADTLPALVSLDPLLQGATTAAEGPGPTAAAETQRRMRLTHIDISSARLAEGRQTWSTDRPTADQPPSRGDCQAIASLTAPLPWFRPGAPEPKKSLKKARSRRGSAGFSSTTNPWDSQGSKCNSSLAPSAAFVACQILLTFDPEDLFSASLRGTGVERSPRKRSPSPPRKRDAGERVPRDLFHFGLAEQPLLPEDAVQAYFESEKARTWSQQDLGALAKRAVGAVRMDQLQEKEKEPKELEKVEGQRRYAIVKPLPHSDKASVTQQLKSPSDHVMELRQSRSVSRRRPGSRSLPTHTPLSAKMDDGSVEDGKVATLRKTATKLVRASGELFPAEHLSKALKGVESAVVRPAITRLEGSAATGSADSRKQRLRAQCGALHRQLLDKKANEDSFLSNVMTFFREEDAKAMNHRMQIQDQLDQFEELRAHQAQQAKEEEALKAGSRIESCDRKERPPGSENMLHE